MELIYIFILIIILIIFIYYPNILNCNYNIDTFSLQVPQVSTASTPQVSTASTPQVSTASTPQVSTASTPQVSTASTPQVSNVPTYTLQPASPPQNNNIQIRLNENEDNSNTYNTTSSIYCCLQIDEPYNKWKDCNKCEDVKPMCNFYKNQDSCLKNTKNKCIWNNNECMPVNIPFAKTVNCDSTFVNDFCFTSPIPKQQPVQQPAQQPTQQPTQPTQPTQQPTQPTQPTQQPTQPTQPTQQPTQAQPTQQPTQAQPTAQPPAQPTAQPPAQPPAQPTSQPPAQPTSQPLKSYGCTKCSNDMFTCTKLPQSNPIKGGRTIPATSTSLISTTRYDLYDAVNPSYTLEGNNYWWRQPGGCPPQTPPAQPSAQQPTQPSAQQPTPPSAQQPTPPSAQQPTPPSGPMNWSVTSPSQFYFPSVLQNERIYIGNGIAGSKKIDAPNNSNSSTKYSISTNFSNNIQIVQQTGSSNAYIINISPVTWGKSFIGSITASQSDSSPVSIKLSLERESQNGTSMRFRFIN
jgi:hypothetical protein